MERCAVNAQDLGGLLLLHSSTGNREGMLALAEDARKAGRTNVAFLSLFVCGKVRENTIYSTTQHNTTLNNTAVGSYDSCEVSSNDGEGAQNTTQH